MLNPMGWLRSAEVDEFGRSLARELAERYTREMDRQADDKKNARKLGRALSAIYARAKDFKQHHRLGVYKKARLGNAFKWELKEMGYRAELIEQATKGLVLSISKE